MLRDFQIVVSLGWLFLAALLGTLLRWHQVWPVDGLVYPYWLHAHSHLAFLGWLFNAFFVIFTSGLSGESDKSARKLFVWLQLPLLGMAISFRTGGYSSLSIVFSTSHILLSWLFAWRWLGKWQKDLSGSWLSTARLAMWFMVFSNVGPFVVGAAQASQNRWLYDNALHYYLYFQYAGFFSFAALAAVQQYFKADWTLLHRPLLAWVIGFYLFSTWLPEAWWLAILLVPVWGWWFFGKAFKAIRLPVKPVLWKFIVIAFLLKWAFEAMYLMPQLYSWAKGLRNLQIGYMHLYFLGVVSPAILLLWFRSPRLQLWWVLVAAITLLLLLLSPWLMLVAGWEMMARAYLLGALLLLLVTALFFYKRLNPLLWKP